MKKLPQGLELTFRNGHSLILGHKPQIVCAEGLCENILTTKNQENVASFGLFGGSADVNKFYPDITADDWMPKDADFIEPVFRGLSETMVSYMGIPISFKKAGVLKASMNLLKGVTVNTNHDTETENAVGSVSKVVWQEGYRANGVNVPAGINMVLKIDAKSNPRLARGIMMDPPSIHSNSVTVRFNHVMSHPELNEEFWNLAGTKDKKGKLIHLIADEITSYKETSFVNHGADPYAQKINDDGVINDPKYASGVYDFSEDKTKTFSNINKTDMDFLELITSLGLTIEGVPDNVALIAHFKAIDENQIPEGIDLTAMQVGVDELAALKVVDENLTPETLTALTANQVTEEQTTILTSVKDAGGVTELVEQSKLGNTYLSNIRENAVTQFKITAGETPSEEIIATIMGADLKAAKAFEAQYSAVVEEKFPMKCITCGSTEISRSSANNPPADPKTPKTFQEAKDEFAEKSRRSAKSIHGEAE